MGPACDVERRLSVAEGAPAKLLVGWLADIPHEIDEVPVSTRLVGSRRTPEAASTEVGEVHEVQPLRKLIAEWKARRSVNQQLGPQKASGP